MAANKEIKCTSVNFCPNARIEVGSGQFQNISDFCWLKKQNTKNIFVPLDGIQSKIPDTIHRIHLSLFAVKLLIF